MAGLRAAHCWNCFNETPIREALASSPHVSAMVSSSCPRATTRLLHRPADRGGGDAVHKPSRAERHCRTACRPGCTVCWWHLLRGSRETATVGLTRRPGGAHHRRTHSAGFSTTWRPHYNHMASLCRALWRRFSCSYSPAGNRAPLWGVAPSLTACPPPSIRVTATGGRLTRQKGRARGQHALSARESGCQGGQGGQQVNRQKGCSGSRPRHCRCAGSIVAAGAASRGGEWAQLHRCEPDSGTFGGARGVGGRRGDLDHRLHGRARNRQSRPSQACWHRTPSRGTSTSTPSRSCIMATCCWRTPGWSW
jgi:hypothetical protein